jgi:uncharacterized protein (DUF433 family)
MAWYDEYIERREGFSGGYPCLKRFRMSVRIIVEWSRQTPDFAALCEALPACTPEEIRAALAYYEDHKELIEEDIERNQKAWEEVVAGKWRQV